MDSVGMIHMACYCGADLFYIGNDVRGNPREEIVELFRARLGSGNFGFFSSQNGRYGECPSCGLLYELPEPGLMDWLPFLDKGKFLAAVEEMLDSYVGAEQTRLNGATIQL